MATVMEFSGNPSKSSSGGSVYFCRNERGRGCCWRGGEGGGGRLKVDGGKVEGGREQEGGWREM